MRMFHGRTLKTIFSLVAVVAVIAAAYSGFASEGGGAVHHADTAAQLKDMGWRILNFAVLVAILVWSLKKANVKSSLAVRQANIEKELQEARNAKEAAEARLAEYSAKLDEAAKEIDELYAAIVREGETEKERIISEARRLSEKIAEQAALTAAQEAVKASLELRAEAARLSVEIASGKLVAATGKTDHDRFVGEYLDKVVPVQ